MDKMREEFSKHCQTWRYSEEIDENDFFVNATTQRAWDVWVTAWQASRQALVVELPATCCRTLVFEIEGTNEVGMEHDEYYEVDDILSALNDAGIKCT